MHSVNSDVSETGRLIDTRVVSFLKIESKKC